MKALQGVLIIVAFLGILLCVAGAALGGQVVAPAAPTPAPQPTPGNPSAGVVEATFNGLEQVGVGDLVRSGAEANRANTAAVHTSDLGQFVADVAPLLPFCIAGLIVAGMVGTAWAAAWTYTKETQRRSDERLAAAVEQVGVRVGAQVTSLAEE